MINISDGKHYIYIYLSVGSSVYRIWEYLLQETYTCLVQVELCGWSGGISDVGQIYTDKRTGESSWLPVNQ